MAVPAQQPDSVSPGDVLGGRYLVTRVVGRGGMGVVVEARSADRGERFAIKVLHARHCANPEAVARFQQEARAAVQLRSDHVVSLLDVGTTWNGIPYFVMELLEGCDLVTLLRQGALPPQQAVLYVLQACEGIAEVHASGIVHRDLKPGNLFVTSRRDGSPLVKVLDFGIAKTAGPLGEAERNITMTLVAMGTPLYMAPEQIRCSKTVDARADLWSLGTILYELLAGRPAFGGNTVANITAQVLEANPVPLVDLAPGVPPELDRVVRKALAKRPESRYPDVGALALALSPFAGRAAWIHAERAAHVLRTKGAASAVLRGTAGSAAGDEPSDAITSGLSLPVGRRRPEHVLQAAAVILALAVLVIGWAVVDTYRAEVAAASAARAAKAVAATAAVRGAVVQTAARIEARAAPEGGAVTMRLLPPVGSADEGAPFDPAPAAAGPAPTGRSVLGTANGRAGAPQPGRFGVPRRMPPAHGADILSSRK